MCIRDSRLGASDIPLTISCTFSFVSVPAAFRSCFAIFISILKFFACSKTIRCSSSDKKESSTPVSYTHLAKEAEKILAEPFASGDILREKSERLTTLRDDLNQEAMEAAKSGNKPQRTFYFEMAKLKKNARTISKSTLEKAEGKKKAEFLE